ncbi:MAG: YibE/F family protein [Anaerocolumna sp.]
MKKKLGKDTWIMIRNQKKLWRKRKWDKTSTVKLITLCAAIIIIIAGMRLIDITGLQNGEESIQYYPAKVLQVIEDSTMVDTATEGVRRGSQVIKIEITAGPYKGKTVTIDNYISALFNIYTREGTRIIVRSTVYEDGPEFSVYNYDRTPILYGFVILFMVSLCVIGGKKGFMSLLSLGITLIVVIKLSLPLLIKGYPAIITTIAIIIFSTVVNFILIDGINVKTVSAAIGTIAGVILSGGLAYIAGYFGHVTGFQMEEAESLLLIAGDSGLKIKNILISGILIASLGAVMDVAMSIASSIHELHQVKPSLSAKELFRSGMNIGRDAMGTMANTLILAFTGSSLNLLLMIYSYGIPYSQLINTDIIAIEIIRGIAGSIGIVLTVPIIAYVSSRIEKKFIISEKVISGGKLK